MRPLTEMAAGRAARIAAVADGPLRARLARWGLLEGSRLETIQVAPAFVVRLGASTLALEREVAARILVEAEGPDA